MSSSFKLNKFCLVYFDGQSLQTNHGHESIVKFSLLNISQVIISLEVVLNILTNEWMNFIWSLLYVHRYIRWVFNNFQSACNDSCNIETGCLPSWYFPRRQSSLRNTKDPGSRSVKWWSCSMGPRAHIPYQSVQLAKNE